MIGPTTPTRRDRAMPRQTHDRSAIGFEQAGRRLLTACGVRAATRRVRLADPPVAVRVLEAGDGPPLVLVHGSGMSASTWVTAIAMTTVAAAASSRPVATTHAEPARGVFKLPTTRSSSPRGATTIARVGLHKTRYRALQLDADSADVASRLIRNPPPSVPLSYGR